MKTKSFSIINIIKRSVLLLCLISSALLSKSQIAPPITVSFVLQPPYSSNYSSYENLSNRIIINLVGGARAQDIVLHGRLSNTDRDFSIATKQNYIGGVFNLGIAQPKTIINDPTQLRFLARNNIDRLSSSDADWTRLMSENQLPEGQYELCINAFAVVGGQVSNMAGSACFTFYITNAQPPVITSPVNGQELDPSLPNTVFAWTPPIGNTLGANIVYDLYVVKVLKGQNPNEAMNGAVNYKANNPLIKTNLTTNQYVTQPYDLTIDSNTLYAAQVIARDASRQVSFKNNGRSEVVTFRKGKANKPGLILTVTKEPKEKSSGIGYPVTNVDPVPYSQLKGKLYYKFKDKAGPTPKANGQIQQSSPKNVQLNLSGADSKPTISNSLSIGLDNMSYNKDNISISGAEPLAGKNISLVVTYIFSGTANGQPLNDMLLNKNSSLFPKGYDDDDKVIATTTTKTDGSFTFDFVNAEKVLGVLDYQFSYYGGMEGAKVNYEGKFYKVLRIRVEDKYYCSPDVNIKVDPWKGIDLGNLVSYVKSYSLKVKVTTTKAPFWDMAEGIGTRLSNITTMIIRKKPVSAVPSTEGENSGKLAKLPDGSRQLSSHVTDGDGFVTFYNLVQHDKDNKIDRYYIKCVPNDKDGTFTFGGKEMVFYAHGTVPFPFVNSDAFNSLTVQKDIIWNHELEIKTYLDSISLIPTLPRIAGKLEVAQNVEAKSLSGKNVAMMSFYTNSTMKGSSVKTDALGRYQFNKLDVEERPLEEGEVLDPTKPRKVIGPKRTILVKPDGFEGQSKEYPPLPWGKQLPNEDFKLYPDGKLIGYIEDELGNPVHADVDVDELSKTTTEPIFTFKNIPGVSGNMKIPTGYIEGFDMKAPSGKRKVTIKPQDHAYATLDTTININLASSKPSSIKFVVRRAQKRLRFRIVEAPENVKRNNLSMPVVVTQIKPIGRALVKLDAPGKPVAAISDVDGYVTLIFESQSSTHNFIITTPEDPGKYEEASYTINNSENTIKTVTYSNAYLKKAATITGTITVGPDKKPLQGASVYIEMGGGKRIEAQSNAEGKYVLNGIPKSPAERTVWASKSGSSPNIISQNKKLTIAQNNEVNFNLLIDNELTIENIFGFEVDIQSKAKASDGTWLISGSLINLPENDNFALHDNKQSIPFHDLKIKKSGIVKDGIPVGTPATDILSTDLANIKLLLQNSFAVIQTPSSGDLLEIKGSNQKGSLMGKIYIQKASFQFTQEYVKFNDDPELAMLLTESPGTFNTNLPSVEADKPTKKKFGVANLSAKALSFKILGFDAESDAVQSWVQDNSISIQINIQINGLPGMTPSKLAINVGSLVIHPEKIEPLKGDKPIKFNLEKWQFIGDTWQLSTSGGAIHIPTGTMKTGSLDVPLENVSLTPDKISIGNFNINNLSFAGIVPVNVITTKPAFGFNKSVGSDQKGHYELSLIGEEGSPGVTIKSLPGMKVGEEMKFQNFSLISNGEQRVLTGNQPNTITFYNVMKVKPITFTSGTDYVNMDCGIDLNIPQLEETMGVIQFSKSEGQVKFKLYPLNVSLQGPGGVNFSANVKFNETPQTLTEGKFTALGTIHDKEGINLKGFLVKTPQEAWIQVDPENQKMPLGGNNTSLANIKGKMEADMSNGQWKNFTFSGEMIGFTGMQGNTRKTFVVTGSINAVNQNMEVKNISGGFAGISFTYDIVNSRFTGNLEIDQSLGPLSVKGTAALIVDPIGWYFIAGAQLQAPGLGEFSAGILIGDYKTMPGEVSQKLMQYAYDKNVPPGFQNGISGFFFTGKKTLPISVPNVDINLVIIKVSFGVEAGLDARLWMNFSDGGKEIGIGVMAFIHAYLKGSAITCTKFYADARAEIGVTGIYNITNGVFTVKGCGSFKISGGIKQCFPYPCFSDGICCGGCGSVSTSVGFRLDLILDSNGNSDMSFGKGSCSGQ